MKRLRLWATSTLAVAVAIGAGGAALADAHSSGAKAVTAAVPTRTIRHHSGTRVTGGIGTIASITVSCRSGEVAVGGGGTPADGNWAILLSRPENATGGTSGTPTKWRVDFGNYNDTTNAGAIPNAYAVCESGAPTEVIRHLAGPRVTGGIGSIASVTVSCHPGEVAVGGGGTSADGNWAMLLSSPENATGGTSGTPSKWRADFGNYNDTTSAGAIPNAYAVCESGSASTQVIRTASGPRVTGGIGSIASETVACNSGEVAVGGGGTPADGNWAMLLSSPENATGGTSGTPTKWRADFGNYNDTTNAGAIPNAYVVCESP